MHSIYSVDLKLLNKFQNVTDRIEQYSGQNNFRISSILRFVMIFCFIVREIIAFVQGMNTTEYIIIVCSVIILLKMGFMQKKAEEAFKNTIELMNPIIIDYALTRVIIQFVAMGGLGFLLNHLYNILNFRSGVIITATEIKEICWDLFAILLFFVAYLNSCTPKPTNTIKVRKHLKKSLLVIKS